MIYDDLLVPYIAIAIISNFYIMYQFISSTLSLINMFRGRPDSLVFLNHMPTDRNFQDFPPWIVAPTASIIITITLALLALSHFKSRYDPREPPVLPQKVPFFGHLLGLLRHGLKYYTIIK